MMLGPVNSAGQIDARPTKNLFISMLVKDIPLIRAIVDLVDNSIDGARRTRGRDNYQDLYVLVEVSEDHFRIVDNCGGIPIDLARHYAFRFGRSEDTPPTSHSIGQFGVGMKRALFKIGNVFRIESAADGSRFSVDVNVEEWKQSDQWTFDFTDEQEGIEVPREDRGTTIHVTELRQDVSEDFGRENFRLQLVDELREAQRLNLEKGLSISINGVPIQSEAIELLFSKDIKPASKEILRTTEGVGEVTTHLYAGISESSPRKAGWYVFCNGRLLLGPDQTITTGWGADDGKAIPRFHNQFARFRGYALFESKKAELLPWNTTKTGVDADSRTYKATRLEMINLMRPVLDFLNRLDAEKDRKGDPDQAPMHMAVQNANSRGLEKIPEATSFRFKKPKPAPPPPDMVTIQYRQLRSRVDRAKKVLKVKSYKKVGEKTFEYFYERECEPS